MNEPEHEKKLADLLKQSIAPVSCDPRRDLWPEMRRRLDEGTDARPWFAALFSPDRLLAAPWFDWALLAALVVAVCVFPRSIPIWLYHF